jgi:predicted acylesterase/phospholipase RssA
LLPPEEVAYDVVSGISAGAINGIGFSFFEKGDEKNAVEFLEKIWSNITR